MRRSSVLALLLLSATLTHALSNVGETGGAGVIAPSSQNAAGQPPQANPGPPTLATKVIREPLVIPHEEALCYVQRVRATTGAGSTSTNANGGGFLETQSQTGDAGTPEGLLRHLATFTGLDDILTQEGTTTAQLARPENLEFRRVATHYFSSVDPRSTYAVLGTPGGDMGEFINALSAAERLNGRLYDQDTVNAIFQDLVKLLSTRGRKYFYYSTDEAALNAWKSAAGAANAREPASYVQRNKLIDMATNPQHVGDQHIRAMLANPAQYKVRKPLVEWAIRAFLNTYYDSSNPLRPNMLFVVLRGEFAKATGYAKIYSPDQCPGIAPLLVPKADQANPGVVIFHEAHVAFFRQTLSRYFAFRNGELNVRQVYRAIQEVGTAQQPLINVYTDAQPTNVIFTSQWDRWPF